MSNIIYFDNNATTQVAPEVLEAMLPFFKDMYGNASSMHSFGGQVGKHIAVAREQIAELLGAMPDEILFTSCGTESDNTAVIPPLKHSLRKSISSPPAWSMPPCLPWAIILKRKAMM